MQTTRIMLITAVLCGVSSPASAKGSSASTIFQPVARSQPYASGIRGWIQRRIGARVRRSATLSNGSTVRRTDSFRADRTAGKLILGSSQVRIKRADGTRIYKGYRYMPVDSRATMAEVQERLARADGASGIGKLFGAVGALKTVVGRTAVRSTVVNKTDGTKITFSWYLLKDGFWKLRRTNRPGRPAETTSRFIAKPY